MGSAFVLIELQFYSIQEIIHILSNTLSVIDSSTYGVFFKQLVPTQLMSMAPTLYFFSCQ